MQRAAQMVFLFLRSFSQVIGREKYEKRRAGLELHSQVVGDLCHPLMSATPH